MTKPNKSYFLLNNETLDLNTLFIKSFFFNNTVYSLILVLKDNMIGTSFISYFFIKKLVIVSSFGL